MCTEKNRERLRRMPWGLTKHQPMCKPGPRPQESWRITGERGPIPVAEADGLICTDRPGVGLLIKQADCQALVLVAPGKAVGNFHVGWRGNVANFPKKAVQVFCREFGVKASELHAAVSPSLGPCCGEFVNYRKELPRDFRPFKVGSAISTSGPLPSANWSRPGFGRGTWRLAACAPSASPNSTPTAGGTRAASAPWWPWTAERLGKKDEDVGETPFCEQKGVSPTPPSPKKLYILQVWDGSS